MSLEALFGGPTMSLQDLFGAARRSQHRCDDECIKNAVRQLPWVEEVEITHVPAPSTDLIIPDGALHVGLRIKLKVTHSYPEGIDIRPLIHEWVDDLKSPVRIEDLDLVRVEP